MNFFGLLFGSRRVFVRQSDSAAMLNVCMKYGFRYFKMGNIDEKTYIDCSYVTATRVLARCAERGIEAELGELRGVPSLFLRCRKRYGIFLGAVLAFFIVASSKNYVWDIRVSGYDGLDTERVVVALAECGFYKGSSLRDFSADEVENLFLRRSEDIGWISVNMRGTVAYVEVLPKYTPPESEPKNPANVVAAHDGVIVEMITYSGLRMVEMGQTVRAGELLISGAYGEKTPGLHITRASGRVMAKTFRTFSLEIPLEYEQKIETGRIFCEKFIIFFGNEIKVFSNYRNLGTTCVKIIEEGETSFFGSPVPISTRDEIYREYETVKLKRTEAEAKGEALKQLAALLESELGDVEILKRSDNIRFTESSCIIECEIICIEDIAKIAEFSASDVK